MDLFCPDTVNNFYYWKQDKISGRSRVGGRPPPLIFRPNWGLKKILCETTPPYVRVLMTRPPPYLKVWIRHWGYKLLLLIDCYKQVTCGEWVKQRRPLSSSLHSSFTLFRSAKYFPRGKGVGMLVVSLRVFSGQNAIILSCNHWATPRLGGWGWGYSHIKGVGMLVVSLRVFSGQNAIILSCNRWATPRLVSFRGVIQNFQWASPPISYGSPPQRDLPKVGLLLGYPLNWVVSFLQLVIWMGPGHWCPKPRKFGET